MNEGWVKIHRKFREWEWYQKSDMVHLFLHLLLSANHEDRQWQNQIIRRGQLITGLKKLSKNTGISIQRIRTCIERLKSTEEILCKSTNKFRVITIIKYEEYQDDRNKLTSKTYYNKQTINNQATTNKNDKNDNNIVVGKANAKNMYYYDETAFSDEQPTRKKPQPKYSKELRDTMDRVIGSYMALYKEQIKNIVPYCNKATVYRNMAEPLEHFGEKELVRLMKLYLETEDKYWRSKKWSILTFLSMETLNKLQAT